MVWYICWSSFEIELLDCFWSLVLIKYYIEIGDGALLRGPTPLGGVGPLFQNVLERYLLKNRDTSHFLKNKNKGDRPLAGVCPLQILFLL